MPAPSGEIEAFGRPHAKAKVKISLGLFGDQTRSGIFEGPGYIFFRLEDGFLPSYEFMS
jgi:hypothetical protein